MFSNSAIGLKNVLPSPDRKHGRIVFFRNGKPKIWVVIITPGRGFLVKYVRKHRHRSAAVVKTFILSIYIRWRWAHRLPKMLPMTITTCIVFVLQVPVSGLIFQRVITFSTWIKWHWGQTWYFLLSFLMMSKGWLNGVLHNTQSLISKWLYHFRVHIDIFHTFKMNFGTFWKTELWTGTAMDINIFQRQTFIWVTTAVVWKHTKIRYRITPKNNSFSVMQRWCASYRYLL